MNGYILWFIAHRVVYTKQRPAILWRTGEGSQFSNYRLYNDIMVYKFKTLDVCIVLQSLHS